MSASGAPGGSHTCAPGRLPVSLVATVLDARTSLGQFRHALDALDPQPCEIVVVDGGSTDGTLEELHAWSAARGGVSVLSRPGANISRGRNVAVTEARHDVVVATDAGATFASGWLGTIARAALAPDVDVASGFFEPGGSTRFERMLGAVITPHVAEIDPRTFLPSSRSVAFTRHAWASVGGYPEWLDYCEDLVFDMALKDGGARFVLVPDAVVTWDARPDLRSFVKQYFRYARGDGKARILGRRHAARYAAYGSGALLALLACRTDRRAAGVLGALTACYLAKPVRRVLRHRALLGRDLLPTLGLVPVVVVAGDLAKMAGYPVGRRWRHARDGSR